jgi:hypothetical protein
MYHQPYDYLQPIAGQSQYAIVSENRVDWLYFDLLSLVARFQNRAIRCDWGLIAHCKNNTIMLCYAAQVSDRILQGANMNIVYC